MNKIYFKNHQGEYYTKYTKEEIYSKIDPYNWDTILPWLEELDLCPWEEGYYHYLQKQLKLNRDEKYAFGKFVNLMRLASFKYLGFKDGDIVNKKI